MDYLVEVNVLKRKNYFISVHVNLLFSISFLPIFEDKILLLENFLVFAEQSFSVRGQKAQVRLVRITANTKPGSFSVFQ